MTNEQAEQIAKQTWGSRGFARMQRRFSGKEEPGIDGWIRPEGEVIAYEIGYHRTGKKGARLSTVKGSSSFSFDAAFIAAQKTMTGEKVLARLERALDAKGEKI